jgi:hypothetical protein
MVLTLFVLFEPEKHFNLGVAIVWLLVLLVLSIPVGFLIALGIRTYNERHPIEETEDEKHPLRLNDD